MSKHHQKNEAIASLIRTTMTALEDLVALSKERDSGRKLTELEVPAKGVGRKNSSRKVVSDTLFSGLKADLEEKVPSRKQHMRKAGTVAVE